MNEIENTNLNGEEVKTSLLNSYFYIENINSSAITVSITKNNTNAPTLNLEYSTDGDSWTTATMNENTTANTFTCPANGKLYLRGGNDVWCIYSNYTFIFNNITATGNHNVGGNIMSLLYGSEFEGKTEFPTTNGYVLYGMFYNNNKLVNAQDLLLPATTLAVNCYNGMFYNCTSLTTAPELPATTLAQQCYSSMFSGCSKLTTAPELPATTLEQYCYSQMFQNCSSLTTAPELPATTLASNCYQSMFYGCSSLTKAPELPATTLAQSCYYGMFQNCTSLATAPELPATTLATSCYYGMFQNCSKLNYIKAKFTSYNSNNFTNWVSGVSSTGTFVYNPEATFNPEEIRGVNGIPTGWTIKKTYSNTHFYIVNKSSNNSLIITNNSSNNIQYLVDDSSEWSTLSSSNEPQIISFKDGITLKGNNTSLNGLRIKTSKDSSLNGNLTALLYSDNYTTNDNIIPTNSKDTFRYLFVNYRTLKDVSKLILPNNTVDNCYQHMFTGCKSLTSLPVFPDNNIELNDYCYHGMFMDCERIF